LGEKANADKLRALRMPISYNQIAGQSRGRLAALSDGVFAVAMTLLLLELHVPAREAIHTERELLHAMGAFGPQLAVYLMSFLTLGIFWVGQQTQLNHLERSNRNLTWLHLAFLFSVTLMPVSTRFLTEFAQYRSALLAYWANIVLLGGILYLSWGCATQAKLIKNDMPPDVPAAICRRIVIGQSLYAFGALLCVFNTYWSIAFIVLVQLYYAIAPQLGTRKADL
jgi:TMEM175 potassium channel family protein